MTLFQEGGQCQCKTNVEGRQCDVCRTGFFNLSADNPLGCQDCGCDPAGTLAGNIKCSSLGGQCICKDNVRGRLHVDFLF